MKKFKLGMWAMLLCVISACKKSDFLGVKPSSDLIVPVSLNDLQALLDNTSTMNFSGGLAQLSADDYSVSTQLYQSVQAATQRNAFIWAKDIYNGETGILDWNRPYTQIFYCNAVLEGLAKSAQQQSPNGKYLEGWALFNRAFAFYEVTRNFCKPYDVNTANSDLGIPLRLKAGLDYLEQRSSLKLTFDKIIGDLLVAEQLLPASRPTTNLNRPSKIAVYALLARIYLDTRDYTKAEFYADQCLSLYSTLIDYKLLNKTATTPFSTTNDELIYNVGQVGAYSDFTGEYTSAASRIPPNVIALYATNDVRISVYFTKLPDQTYTKTRGYKGTGVYPFTGLATDEVYLIKAECLARRNELSKALEKLNQLVIKRWDPMASTPAKPYQNITANTPEEVLQSVLLERRKELIWRGLRWHDLKRLNKEGANISLSRNINGITYTLPPNDPRWVFPIPDDEISLSGIQQNVR